jgi:hypothetical protein
MMRISAPLIPVTKMEHAKIIQLLDTVHREPFINLMLEYPEMNSLTNLELQCFFVLHV